MSRNERISNRYCSVPQCNSYCTKTVKMHCFPSNPILRKKWQIVLKIGKPITKSMCVCSKHFAEDSYCLDSANRQKKFLKKNSLPSLNLPCGVVKKKTIKQRSLRLQAKLNIQHHTTDNNVNVTNNCEFSVATNQQIAVVDKMETCNVIGEVNSNEQENCNLEQLANVASQLSKMPTQLNKHIQCNLCTCVDGVIYSILRDEKGLFSFTGVPIDTFNLIVTAVENVLEDNPHISIENVPTWVVLVLIKLKLNLHYTQLSVLFNKHVQTLKKNFSIMVPLMVAATSSCIYWPTLEENKGSMPLCFKKYSKTRVVLDCTELTIESSKCLKCRCRSYSYYKSKHTAKYLIGVTPSGLICYISSGYGGRTSDKAIFEKENILSKLEPFTDHVMADKGFLIADECESHGIKLIRPPFLSKQKQLTKSQTEETASIARARVHVERAIQRIKLFKIVSEKVQNNILPYLDDIMKIICAIVNLSTPILDDDKF